MNLRHTYAVHALEDGMNIREVQIRLGHARLDSTMLYQRCLLPEDAACPLDGIAQEEPVITHAEEDSAVPPLARPDSGSSCCSGARRTPFRSRLRTWLRRRLSIAPG